MRNLSRGRTIRERRVGLSISLRGSATTCAGWRLARPGSSISGMWTPSCYRRFPVPAFPHDHTEQAGRTLATPEGPLPYMQALLGYMSVAILTGCPATVAPAGKAKGLPVGIQILGPYLEDATPIRLASLLAKENGGFTPPPGY